MVRTIRMAKKTVETKEEVTVEQDGGAKKTAKRSSGSKTAKSSKGSTTSGSKNTGSKASGRAGRTRKTGNRFFKMIDAKTMQTTGRYTGVTPKQAAGKGYTKYIQKLKQNKQPIPASTTIYMKESTRGSFRKVYGYTASRQKLQQPQALTIKGPDGEEKQIVYHFRNRIKKVTGDLPPQLGGARSKSGSKSKSSKKSTGSKASGSKTGRRSAGSKTGAKSGSKTAKRSTGSKSAKSAGRSAGSKTANKSKK
jgi:hypothetical protein